MEPKDLNEYLVGKLDHLPLAARLVVVLDPGGRLSLSDELGTSTLGWAVLRYDGNDLAFRRQYRTV